MELPRSSLGKRILEAADIAHAKNERRLTVQLLEQAYAYYDGQDVDGFRKDVGNASYRTFRENRKICDAVKLISACWRV